MKHLIKKHGINKLLIVLLLASIQVSAQTTSINVSPLDDAFVRDGSYANSNYGSLDGLTIKEDNSSGYRRETYLKFNLSSIPGTISSAILKTTAESKGTSSSIMDINFVSNDSWNESTITWNNKPSQGLALDNNDMVLGVTSWDVTSQAESERLGDGVLSVALNSITAGGERWINYHSREALSPGDRPVLEVTYVTPTVPNAPSNLSSSAISASQINLLWSDNSDNETGFKIERKTDGGAFTTITTTDANVTSYNNTNLERSTTYTYRVVAVNSLGASSPTNESSATTPLGPGTTYYIDASQGNDSNDGMSPSSAWQSLDKVNGTTFQPGDQILFEAGETWLGRLHPKGNGDDILPIIIGSYNVTEGNPYPLIQGDGISDAVALIGQEYWHITNLEVTNPLSPGHPKRGIYVENYSGTPKNHIHILNNYVHDVAGNGSKGVSVGIHVYAPDNFDDVLIEGNTVINVKRTGISTSSGSGAICGTQGDNCQFTNLVIRNNYLERPAGDGIIMRNSKNGLVEYNISNQAVNTQTNANIAMWSIGSWGATFQFNEAYNTKTTVDGQAWDSDFSQTGCTFQYNWSHDNEGGFLLVIGTNSGSNANRHTTIRYNISQNDGNKLFRVTSNSFDLDVYNNLFYLPLGSETRPYTGNSPQRIDFSNNIFYLESAGSWDNWNNIGGYRRFNNNVVYGVHTSGEPTGNDKITLDPKLVFPGSGNKGRDNVAGYKLLEGSPALNAGISYDTDNGGRDYWGHPVLIGTNPHIGPYNGPAIKELLLSGNQFSGNVVADAYVDEGSINSNYDTDELKVKASEHECYLRFGFEGIYRGVKSAKVRLAIKSAESGVTSSNYSLMTVDDEVWNEGTITYANAPQAGNVVATISGQTSGVMEWDITSLVQEKRLGSQVVSLKLVSDNAGITFYSDEAISSKPELVIEINDPVFASADAFVRDGSFANVNYGSDELLFVKLDGSSGYTRESFLQFDLSTVTGSIDKAILRLHTANIGRQASISDYELEFVSNDSWTESGITWNNKPAANGSIEIVQGRSGFIEFDVTSYVQTEHIGDGNISFKVRGLSSGSVRYIAFGSKENSDSRIVPVLELDISNNGARVSDNKEQLVQEDLEEDAESLEVSIYPNPVANELHILSPDQLDRVQVIDINGRVLQNIERIDANSLNIDVSHLSKGMYILKLRTNNAGSVSRRFLK